MLTAATSLSQQLGLRGDGVAEVDFASGTNCGFGKRNIAFHELLSHGALPPVGQGMSRSRGGVLDLDVAVNGDAAVGANRRA